MTSRFRAEILTVAIPAHTAKDDILASVLTTLGEAHEADRSPGDARLHRSTGQVSVRVTYQAADLDEARHLAQHAVQRLHVAADVTSVKASR